ncbi:hypothetical protein HU200_001576 [Digitaria exilis]|uniref:Uncharacterized protein n=1 Tax=Digitaria exilis TaxID=1010633 RepID=A0A835FX54_9POAL|nr:hypothetical protein HU200_001576 [Digitaria exilis]
MTNEEKKEAIARRLETPSLCHCGDPAQIHRTVKKCSFTPTFLSVATEQKVDIRYVLFLSMIMARSHIGLWMRKVARKRRKRGASHRIDYVIVGSKLTMV